MVTYPQNTPARCNACQSKFSLPKDVRGYEMDGKAARLTGFATCPTCGRMDTHWVYLADLPATTAEHDLDTIAGIDAELAEARVRLANAASMAQVDLYQADIADLEYVRRALVADAKREAI